MNKDWFIFHAGRSVVSGGMFDRDAAVEVARNAARRHPGRTYTVMQKVKTFQFVAERRLPGAPRPPLAPPAKTCSECFGVHYRDLKTCPYCGA